MTKFTFTKEKLIFLKRIEKIFLDEILPEESFVTDESTLNDFISMFDISRSIKHVKDNKYLFEITTVSSNFKDRKTTHIIIEGEDNKFRITHLVKEKFDLDISDKFNLPFPELFIYISKNSK
jgi:hypothetical protein